MGEGRHALCLEERRLWIREKESRWKPKIEKDSAPGREKAARSPALRGLVDVADKGGGTTPLRKRVGPPGKES